MRAFLSAIAFLATLSTAAIAGPKEEALQVLEKWTKAFTDSDVDGIVRLYAPDALFFGTGSKTVVVKPEGIRTYFENALLNNRPRSATLGDYVPMTLSDTAVVITGLDTVTGYVMKSPLVRLVVSRSSSQNAARIGKSCISIVRQCQTDRPTLMSAFDPKRTSPTPFGILLFVATMR
jgi:Domain of unknown function (DUF4440)